MSVNLNTKNVKTLRKQIVKFYLDARPSLDGRKQTKYDNLLIHSQPQKGKMTKAYYEIVDVLQSKGKLTQQKPKKLTTTQLFQALPFDFISEEKDMMKNRRIAVYGHFKTKHPITKKITKTIEPLDVIKFPKGLKESQIMDYIESKYREPYEENEDYYYRFVKTLSKLTYQISSVSEAKNLTLAKIPMKNAFVLEYTWLKYAEGISKKSFSDMSGRCVYELLVEHLKPRWTTINADVLFNIFNEYNEKSVFDIDYKPLTMESGVSTEMINYLCELKNISMYAFDINDNCFYKVIGDDKFKPIAFYMIDGHMYQITNPKMIRSVAECQKHRKITSRKSLNSNLLNGLEIADKPFEELECVECSSFDEALQHTDKNVFIPCDNITSQTLHYIIKNKMVPLIISKKAHKITGIYIKESNLSIYCDLNIQDGLTWQHSKQLCTQLNIPFKNQTIGALIQHIKKEFFKPNRVFIPVDKRCEIVNSQNGLCSVCKIKLENNFEIDHIIPLCKKGTNNIENLQALCKKCHRMKTADDLEELVKYDEMASTFNETVSDIVKSRLFKQWAFVEKLYPIDINRKSKKVQKNLNKIDHIKCRRNLVMHNKYDFPVFSVMDTPIKYENGDIQVGYYYIESENYYPLRGNGFYPYHLVKFCLENNIIQKSDIKYELKSSFTLPKDKFKQFSEFLINITSSIDPKISKLIINAMVGTWGTTKSDISSVELTINKDDAIYRMTQNDKAFVQAEKIGDQVVYQIFQNTEIIKDDSYITLYNHIIASETIELYKLEQLIIKNGGVPMERNTDAILYCGDRLPIDEHYYDDEKTAPKYQYEEKPKPLRVESVCKFTRKNKYELDIKEWNDTPDTNDFEQLSDTIIKMGSCLINGRAGTGKTHLIKMIIKKLEAQKKNIYKLAPTNKASRLIDGMTIHKMYVSLCLSRMGKSKIIKNLKNINTIIIDEISMVHEIFYRMFNLIKKYCPHINFIIVGDFLQLKPVNDRYTGNYSNSTTLLELCNYNRLVLDKCRRSDDTLFNLTNPTNIPSINPQLFKTNQLFFNTVAYTHKTRKNVNGLCMEKYIKEHPYYITAQALDSNDKTQISYLAQGMPIISYKNIPKQKILNTDIFTITKINRKTKEFSFKSENIEEQTMKADKFSTMFYPAFCITIHASQGQTFETPYTIWDWTILDNTLKYVALTRATDIKNISIHI